MTLFISLCLISWIPAVIVFLSVISLSIVFFHFSKLIKDIEVNNYLTKSKISSRIIDYAISAFTINSYSASEYFSSKINNAEKEYL